MLTIDTIVTALWPVPQVSVRAHPPSQCCYCQPWWWHQQHEPCRFAAFQGKCTSNAVGATIATCDMRVVGTIGTAVALVQLNCGSVCHRTGGATHKRCANLFPCPHAICTIWTVAKWDRTKKWLCKISGRHFRPGHVYLETLIFRTLENDFSIKSIGLKNMQPRKPFREPRFERARKA